MADRSNIMMGHGLIPSVSLASSHGLQYEPELFPGLIYRMRQPKIVLLIFVSGKIVLTGAKVSYGRDPALPARLAALLF